MRLLFVGDIRLGFRSDAVCSSSSELDGRRQVHLTVRHPLLVMALSAYFIIVGIITESVVSLNAVLNPNYSSKSPKISPRLPAFPQGDIEGWGPCWEVLVGINPL